jgi:hypothetical protein
MVHPSFSEVSNVEALEHLLEQVKTLNGNNNESDL